MKRSAREKRQPLLAVAAVAVGLVLGLVTARTDVGLFQPGLLLIAAAALAAGLAVRRAAWGIAAGMMVGLAGAVGIAWRISFSYEVDWLGGLSTLGSLAAGLGGLAGGAAGWLARRR